MWRPPDLVDAVASFGAVAHDGALYVYGGHVGRTHVHSMENISPGFRRLVLEPGRTWEELARGPLLQGAALVSDGAAIYRVGGMTAANATGAEPEVLRSSRSAARYSIAEDRWDPLPDLPAGRSSHDAVVAGGTLYVVGGWELRGPDEDAVWAAAVLALDLDDATGWRSIPAPFERRALGAGTAGGRIYALGGLTPDSGPQLRVDVLDIASGEWSRGPDLPPAGSLQGFGVAAASHRDRVFMSQGRRQGLQPRCRYECLEAGGEPRRPPLHAPACARRGPDTGRRRLLARRTPRHHRSRLPGHRDGGRTGERHTPKRAPRAGPAFSADGTPTSAGPPACP